MNIKVVRSPNCGEIVPCADYFTAYPFNSTLDILYSFNYTIKVGYNKVYLTQPIQVDKSYFLKMMQITGRIAVDKTSSPKYCDLVWMPLTLWTKMNDPTKWRFYLNTINSYNGYLSTFSVSKVYTNAGLYNIAIRFLGSNQTFYQTVLVSDCNFFLNKIN